MATTDLNRCGCCGQDIAAGVLVCPTCGSPAPQTEGLAAAPAIAGSAKFAKGLSMGPAVRTLALVLLGTVLAVLFVILGRPGPKAALSQYADTRLGAENGGQAIGSRPPQDYLGEGFDRAIDRRLTPAEASLVFNPLSSSPAMVKWARDLTSQERDDTQKAEILFEALSRSAGTNLCQTPRPLTARAAYASLGKTGASLSCQELGFLYVALARAAGLKAYYTFVERDHHGMWLLHGCAAAFIGGRAVLVDPAYHSFGVAHQKFSILDDLEAAGLYLSSKNDPDTLPVARKLAPGLPFVRATMLEVLARQNRWEEAEEELRVMETQESDAPMTYAAQARIAIHRGEVQQAIQLLRKATEMAPQTPEFYFALGSAHALEGHWEDARQAYQQAFRFAVYERTATTARGAISLIDGRQCQARYDWKGALTNYEKAVELRPDYEEAYMARASARQLIGNFQGALADFNKALEIKPELSRAYLGRGMARHAIGDLDGALADCNEAVKMDPGNAVGHRMLGFIRYDRHEFSEALALLQKGIELVPSDDYAHFRMFLARSRIGQSEEAAEELRAYLRQRRAVRRNDWASKVGRFLIGEIAEPELLKQAEDNDKDTSDQQHCEAYFYAASQLLTQQEGPRAVELLQRCVATEVKGFTEYASALIELHFLRPPGPGN